MAKLIGIATHTASRGPITEHQTIKVTKESGLKDDYQGAKRRSTQITLLSLKSWQTACNEVGADIDWTERRANLLIDDIDFDESMVGRQIQIGEILLEITRETDPCSRMDDLHQVLKQALTPDWRGGARCKVLREGRIKIGDRVQLLARY
ncbi:MAG: MOSC domain-containing protein [Pseudomonadota bacterium]|nr:MOSC domain-containing protein [Pseudomonadota bacterium]